MKRTQRTKHRRRASDADGFPPPSSYADVIFELHAESSPTGRSKLKLRGYASASSLLGRTLATIPLCLILVAPSFGFPVAASLAIKGPWADWATTIALGLGIAVGSGFAWLAMRRTQTEGQCPDPSHAPASRGAIATRAAIATRVDAANDAAQDRIVEGQIITQNTGASNPSE
jgi:hypothetical protein